MQNIFSNKTQLYYFSRVHTKIQDIRGYKISMYGGIYNFLFISSQRQIKLCAQKAEGDTQPFPCFPSFHVYIPYKRTTSTCELFKFVYTSHRFPIRVLVYASSVQQVAQYIYMPYKRWKKSETAFLVLEKRLVCLSASLTKISFARGGFEGST